MRYVCKTGVGSMKKIVLFLFLLPSNLDAWEGTWQLEDQIFQHLYDGYARSITVEPSNDYHILSIEFLTEGVAIVRFGVEEGSWEKPAFYDLVQPTSSDVMRGLTGIVLRLTIKDVGRISLALHPLEDGKHQYSYFYSLYESFYVAEGFLPPKIEGIVYNRIGIMKKKTE